MLAAVGLLVLAVGLGAYASIAQASLPFPGLMELSVLLGAGALVLLLAALLRNGAFWLKETKRRDIVMDGSNILYWAGEGVDPSSLRKVIAAVRKAGYHPVVWFDANVGYLIEDRYAGPVRLSKIFGLPAKDVFVAPKGEPADPHILAAARARGALIVTNDRYRDWAQDMGEHQGQQSGQQSGQKSAQKRGQKSGPNLQARLVRGKIAEKLVTLDWPRGAGRAVSRNARG